jgi:hypothetical protein
VRRAEARAYDDLADVLLGVGGADACTLLDPNVARLP